MFSSNYSKITNVFPSKLKLKQMKFGQISVSQRVENASFFDKCLSHFCEINSIWLHIFKPKVIKPVEFIIASLREIGNTTLMCHSSNEKNNLWSVQHSLMSVWGEDRLSLTTDTRVRAMLYGGMRLYFCGDLHRKKRNATCLCGSA